MSIYIDADVIARWEKREFDLPRWILDHAAYMEVAVPATVWQQLQFGVFDWEPQRAAKRKRFLEALGGLRVIPFSRAHAIRAAALASAMKRDSIGFADFQIAATAMVDGAELLTFNTEHFTRVAGLKIAKT